VSTWNELHAECTERVFDRSQFHSAGNEFHARCKGLASEWNSFHFDRSLFDPRGNEPPRKRRWFRAGSKSFLAERRGLIRNGFLRLHESP
jgi:hypothetical protein